MQWPEHCRHRCDVGVLSERRQLCQLADHMAEWRAPAWLYKRSIHGQHDHICIRQFEHLVGDQPVGIGGLKLCLHVRV